MIKGVYSGYIRTYIPTDPWKFPNMVFDKLDIYTNNLKRKKEISKNSNLVDYFLQNRGSNEHFLHFHTFFY